MSILDSLPDPIFFVDRGGCVAYLNRACEAVLGQTEEEICGRGLSDEVGTELDEGLLALLSQPAREVTPASLHSVRRRSTASRHRASSRAGQSWSPTRRTLSGR
jgi:PAS domain S-box-containing protein